MRRNNSDSTAVGHLSDTEVAAIVYSDLRKEISLVRDARRTHLDVCASCRTKVGEARQMDLETAQLLQTLDVSAPSFDVSTVIRNARPTKRLVSRMGRYSTIAASLLVCVLGAVAFALPTSPLGRALKHLVGIDVAPSRPAVATVVPGVTAPATKASAIALAPTGPLTIEFRNGMPASLQVRYCDTTLATLSVVPDASSIPTRGSPAQVRYAVSNNKIRVTTSDAHREFLLTLPEHTSLVYVTSDDQHPMITISAPPENHIGNGCHAPVNIPLSH